MLRSFLYLDTDLVNDFLAQQLGDLPGDTATIRESTSTSGGVSGGLAAGPLQVGGQRGGTGEAEIMRELQSTAGSRFNHLYKLIEDEMCQLEGFDDEIWDGVRRREIVDAVGDGRIPETFMMAQSLSGVRDLMSLLRVFSDAGFVDGSLPQDADNQLNAFEAFGEIFERRPVPFVLESIASRRHKFVTELNRSFLRKPLSDFQGELNIVGQVTRI